METMSTSDDTKTAERYMVTAASSSSPPPLPSSSWTEVMIMTALFSSLKLVYSKQPSLGLTQKFCWVGACVGGNSSITYLGLPNRLNIGHINRYRTGRLCEGPVVRIRM